MDNKTYKVGIVPIDFSEGYIDINKNYRSISLDIWLNIENKLNKKFKFEKIYLKGFKKPKEYINDLHTNKYDLLVGPWYADYERYLKVDFSVPFMKKKILITYSPKIFYKINKSLYLKYIINIWFKPILLIIILSVLCSLLVSFTLKKNITNTFYNVTSGFFGQTSGFINQLRGNNGEINTATCFVIIIIFITSIYIQVFSSAESIKYIYLSNQLDNSVKDLNIYTNTKMGYNLLKQKGAIPIMVKLSEKGNLYRFYTENHQKHNAVGFINTKSMDLNRFTLNNSLNFRTSQKPLGYVNICFAYNKKNKELNYSIDKEIIKLNNQTSIEEVCRQYLPYNNTFIC